MKKFNAIILALLICVPVLADEGMWMLGNLNKQTRKSMKELGLKIPANKLYNPDKPSLTDAVVSFGGFCSGVVVSEDGLVFTNHHCGFSAIQQHTTLEHDYLKDGFVARDRSEELPNPELYVRFLLSTEDVTPRILTVLTDSMTEEERHWATDSIVEIIQAEVYERDSTLIPIVDAYYAGNEFWLSVYRDFNDVRLVFAPPSSIGKLGWDTDNWMWPRHTGDFSVFRIYANKDNEPADYSPDNVPYQPPYVVPVSLDGYKEGSFCMTLGYPGTTERYLSSYGIEEMMTGINQAMIDVRGVKQAIWKREMDKRDDIRIKYASKYDESSNYWKNSIGTNKAIQQLKVLEKKREMEASLQRWIQNTPFERENLLHLLTSLELDYKQRREPGRAMAYFYETFMYGPELIQLALEILNFDFGAEEKQLVASIRKLLDKYENLDLDIDKEVFLAMLREYKKQVSPDYLPEVYNRIAADYGGDDKAFVDSLYANTKLTTPQALRWVAEQDSTFNLFEDPMIALSLDLIVKVFEINQTITETNMSIERDERLFNAAVRRMYANHDFYPDANFTMRLSFGTVRGYTPFDGAEYSHFTTTRGILEKVREHFDDPDFQVSPEILSLVSSGDYGQYANQNGDMSVCFISNNDITGGNSGSAMFNAKGELLGLAFDGNWEAMSSDIIFEPDLQRCIGVDVRYMLFIMEKFGKVDHLIKELIVGKK
ncbi:S46 family peptidase [Bacteroides sp. 224]|uniref:S46 family peptidase n=1 Tax=Bacteroides sp. 224 TaxID=2302936 RepID=UPI0013D5D26B|nr:S46 family peptidase [Bacteroides sp. 224]NDV65483.1 S46 family peptidase [Bacteroides sp. 224]